MMELFQDYNDHAQEIMNKLIIVIDHHLVMQLQVVRLHNTKKFFLYYIFTVLPFDGTIRFVSSN